MNPKPFYLSRKFLMAVLDCVISLALLFIGSYAQPEQAEMWKQTILYIQPVFVAVIAGIAWEDGQALRAGVHPSQRGE